MNNFTNFSKIISINESTKYVNNDVLTVDEIRTYIQAVGKKIPKQIADVVYLTIKYNLCDQKSIDDIKNANKGQLNKIAFNYGIPETEIEDLWKTLKEIKSNIRLLPQYQTASERKTFIKGKLQMSDITIDLETSAGRNAAAKMYMPMVHKIVNGYVGQSRLSKPELMSAALQGFTDAMNDWRKNGDNSAVPFKTYASYRVQQQILNDINQFSHTMKTNWYGAKKMGAGMLDAISLDGMINDEGEFDQDRLAHMGMEDPNYNLTNSEEKNWSDLYKIIESTFKQRDVDIFYRYFGLKEHNREKAKDIAKSMGMSPGNIKPIIDKILNTLKKNSRAMDLLMNLQATYNESLMIDLLGMDKGMIIESIISDDMFILLEELTKWGNKDIFNGTLYSVLDELGNDGEKIEEILKNDFDYLDKVFKSNKKLIIKFLGMMYPTENFSRRTDVSLLEYMDELSILYKKYL
jgi:DNA-directed RNA polymerase specialized sigma subunit